MSQRIKQAFVLLLFNYIVGCSNVAEPDYSGFQTANPLSILVLPPLNNSVEVNASYTYLATISRPLAEKGYYVFPVSVIDTFMKENGLPTPGEMHAVPLDKIREHIGADAVLYVLIKNWGQKFYIVSSDTVVSAHLKLVDTYSGAVLWETDAYAQRSSSAGSGSLTDSIINAVLDQVADSLSDQTYPVARSANRSAIADLPWGPYRLPENVSQ